METRVCKNCGVEKPIDCFRTYYGGRKGRYTQCKECETIESRRKYLARKGSLTDAEQTELDDIRKLYGLREASGLKPPQPASRRRIGVMDMVQEEMKRYQ